MIQRSPPPPNDWQFPKVDPGYEHDLVAIGADLEPGTVIEAYRRSLFPMPLGSSPGQPIGWWSPVMRGIIELPELHVSRSLKRSARRYRVTVNVVFDAVIERCADPNRPGAWISPQVQAAYLRLHTLGWAHSVEVWRNDELVGGLYGLQIGGLFCAESMFHTVTDASKVALVGLVCALEEVGVALLDVQWCTDHLLTLGGREITRREYLVRLEQALALSPKNLIDFPDPSGVANLPRYLKRINNGPTE